MEERPFWAWNEKKKKDDNLITYNLFFYAQELHVCVFPVLNSNMSCSHTAASSSITKILQWSIGLILKRRGFYQCYASILDSTQKHWPDHVRLCSTADLTE